MLNAEAPVEDARNLEIDRVRIGDRGREGRRRATGGVVDVCALDGLLLDEGRVVDGRENEVALGAFIEDTEAATDDGFLLAVDVIGETDARSVGAPGSGGTALRDATEKSLDSGVAGDRSRQAV